MVHYLLQKGFLVWFIGDWSLNLKSFWDNITIIKKKMLVSMIVFFCFLHLCSDFRMTLVNFAGKWRAKTSFWDDSTKDSEATWRDDALCAWHSLGGLWRKFKHGSYKWHVTRSPLILKIFLLLGEHHQNQNLCPYVE